MPLSDVMLYFSENISDSNAIILHPDPSKVPRTRVRIPSAVLRLIRDGMLCHVRKKYAGVLVLGPC